MQFPEGLENTPFNPAENNNKQLFSSFIRVEISSFRRFEISRQTSAKADDSNFNQRQISLVLMQPTTIYLRRKNSSSKKGD